MALRLARVYGIGDKSRNEYRVLVDRVWPRGIRKSALQLDEWLKHIAPSNSLRRWFGHDPRRWDEFRIRYLEELAGHADELTRLRHIAARRDVVLLYSAKDDRHNQAVVIHEAVVARGRA